jgi:hypothetical protein
MRKVPSNGSFTLSCVEHARRDPVRRGPYRHLARAVHRIRIAPPRFGALIPARIPQLGQKPSSARVNSLFGRERPGDCFQWNVKVAGPKFSNTPPSMTTLAMRSSDCIHRKPADQPYVSTRRFPSRNYRPITTPNSHSYLRSQANRRMWPRYIKPRCPSRTGKSNGVTVSMKRNYWSSPYLPSSHNVRRGFFTRFAIIVLQRIT